MQQTVDVFVDMYISSDSARERRLWTYSIFCVRLLRCLLVQLYRAIPEPRRVGRATSTDNSRFFRTRSNLEMSIEHKYKPIMARRSSHTTPTRRSRNGKKDSSSSRFLIIGGSICAIAFIGLLVWFLTRTPSYTFQRSQLDKYVDMTQNVHLLNDGASVYVDMSDGMNYAYSTPESKEILQAIINNLQQTKPSSFMD